MTYEERKAEAMSMTLEELIFNYHRAWDTAENRNATIISLQYLLDERHLQIEALYDTIQGLTDGRDKLKTEVKPEPISSVEVCQWKLRRKEWELEDMTTRLEEERDELQDKLGTIYRRAVATDTRSMKSEQKDFVEYVVRLSEEE